MKKILAFTSVVMIAVCLFMGCTKSTTTTSAYSMSATIGGNATSFNNCFINVGYNPGGTTDYIIEGARNSSDFPYFLIAVPAIKDTTFTFNSTLVTNYAKYFIDTITTKTAVSGTVTITSVSPNVTGTFNCTCTDGTVISAGSFTAKALN